MRTALRMMVVAGLMALPALASAAAPAWLHVRIEDGREGSKVDVNLPLSLMDVALKSAGEGKLSHGRVRLDDTDMDVADMRRAWRELKDAGDVPFVTIDEKHETVRIERKGGRMLMLVSEKKGGREKVRVDVPTSVIDALLSGEGESLDLASAASELRRLGAGEFIKINDGESRVRVWIE